MRKKSLINTMIFLLLMASLSISCTKELSPQESCNFVLNSQKQRISWAGQDEPVSVGFVIGNASFEYAQALEKAVAIWNETMGFEVFVFDGTGSFDEVSNSDVKIFWSKDFKESEKDQQAKTLVQWRGDHIYNAQIGINMVHNKFSVGDEAEYGKVDFVALMVHELGHALGLAHIETSQKSVMFPSLATNYTDRRIPTDEDLDSLSCEY